MNYASIRTCDVANGEGVRVSLFVSGCTHHCPGCFNEEAQAFDYGEPYTTAVEDQVLSRFLHEALHRELNALHPEDQALLHYIYFEDIPYTHRQIARKLHISQQAVSKRHLALLAELRVKLEAEICG